MFNLQNAIKTHSSFPSRSGASNLASNDDIFHKEGDFQKSARSGKADEGGASYLRHHPIADLRFNTVDFTSKKAPLKAHDLNTVLNTNSSSTIGMSATKLHNFEPNVVLSPP